MHIHRMIPEVLDQATQLYFKYDSPRQKPLGGPGRGPPKCRGAGEMPSHQKWWKKLAELPILVVNYQNRWFKNPQMIKWECDIVT